MTDYRVARGGGASAELFSQPLPLDVGFPDWDPVVRRSHRPLGGAPEVRRS